MRLAYALATGGMLALVIAPPASAELAFTLPGGYRSFALTSGATTHQAKGAFVPVVWFGGPAKFFRARFELGGAYLTDERGAPYSYAVGQGAANFGLPLGPLTPYLGVLGHVAYPFEQPADVTGFPYGLMPQVGVGLDLGFAQLDLHAGQGPVWGLSRPQSGAYVTTLTEIGGRLTFGL